jgi:hypothetical protein
MKNRYIVITSINDLTAGIRKFADLGNWKVVIVGDRKSPTLDLNPYPNVTFLSVERQAKLGFKIHDVLPYNHYCRKNLGYLFALREGADLIGDTDDDNIPYDEWGDFLDKEQLSPKLVREPQIPNIYNLYTDQFVWPRGYPLRLVNQSQDWVIDDANEEKDKVAIWQGLADIDPDVDAIYRLVLNNEVTFEKNGVYILDRGVYSPFNSQNTIWHSSAYPLLYLPLHVSFRFTDILRSYIAQRGLWETGHKVAFTEATVFQDRNQHNLMVDFVDEVPVYTQIDTLIESLDQLQLSGDLAADLFKMYELLLNLKIVQPEEMRGVETWLEDIQSISN